MPKWRNWGTIRIEELLFALRGLWIFQHFRSLAAAREKSSSIFRYVLHIVYHDNEYGTDILGFCFGEIKQPI